MIPRRRHNTSKVIQRTTSESLRIGEPDISSRPSILLPGYAKKSAQTVQPAQSASFVVTGVSTRVDSLTCESPDDSEEFSRQTDIETPSFSEDTSYSQYTEDVEYCVCEDIILKQCVSAVRAKVDEQQNQKSVHSSEEQTQSSPIKIITSSSSTTHIPSPGRFIGRFQVVKVESIHPFRRGRWICHDYVDNSEHAPKNGYEFYRGKFIKRTELDYIKNKMREDSFIFDPIIEGEQPIQPIQPPVAIVQNSATQLVFMNAPVMSSNYHPILRTGFFIR